MSAVFSDCGQYRYILERIVGMTGIVILFSGVNGSTAGADGEDQTSRKWIGFAKLNGARGYIAVNPFGHVARDVRELARQADPVGPDNDMYIRRAIERADLLVPCWGSRSKVPHRLRYRFDQMEQLFRDSGKPIKVFGLTKSGDPLHPLFLPYSTQLVDWTRP